MSRPALNVASNLAPPGHLHSALLCNTWRGRQRKGGDAVGGFSLWRLRGSLMQDLFRDMAAEGRGLVPSDTGAPQFCSTAQDACPGNILACPQRCWLLHYCTLITYSMLIQENHPGFGAHDKALPTCCVST